jgi:hypothetical protein
MTAPATTAPTGTPPEAVGVQNSVPDTAPLPPPETFTGTLQSKTLVFLPSSVTASGLPSDIQCIRWSWNS